MVKNKKAFTLVELLAVIVILAVILVIAVPSIMDTITESRKGALASSAKLIASSAETAYISNQTLGIEKDIECKDVSNYTTEDYKSCKIKFVDGKAKVKLIGQGKFEGMAVCSGTKENAEVVEECPRPVSFSTDSWETIKTAVDEGDTSKYNVGDTKEIDLGSLGTHTLRIANKSACPTGSSALASETACGFVVEFADIIILYAMNSNGSSFGGWKDSEMRTYVNETIYNALVSKIGNVIEDTTVVSGGISPNYTTSDKVYLLSTREVWGKKGTSNTVDHDSADGGTITRQLDYYKNKNVSTSSYSGAIKQYSGTDSIWWLRSTTSSYSYSFYSVSTNGDWGSRNANNTNGVSPAFRLG